MKNDKIKKIVEEHYSRIANVGSSCCGNSCGCNSVDNEKISKSLGYSDQEINSAPDANLGLGCGNPIALGRIKEGDIVLDLGSGAGFDSFLAVKKVGDSGKVIGVDMTKAMIDKAQLIAEKYGYKNVEFKLGDIEELPIEDNSIDVIISNCVINLAPDKAKVFQEAHRVLKPNGKMYVSDIVLLKELPEAVKKDEELLTGCVGGALLRDEYLALIRDAGLNVRVLSEDINISKRQYDGIPLESLKVEASKV